MDLDWLFFYIVVWGSLELVYYLDRVRLFIFYLMVCSCVVVCRFRMYLCNW